jgi:hypothetical protein
VDPVIHVIRVTELKGQACRTRTEGVKLAVNIILVRNPEGRDHVGLGRNEKAIFKIYFRLRGRGLESSGSDCFGTVFM